jgi:hypothetical protein
VSLSAPLGIRFIARMPGDQLPSADALILQLSDLLETDDVPLWEFVWHLNATHHEAPMLDKIRRARRTVRQRLGQEYELWRGEWPAGPMAPLTETEVRALATDDAAWSDPESASLLVWVRATG